MTTTRDGSAAAPSQTLNRRTVVTAAAWVAPTVAVSTALPAMAASASATILISPSTQTIALGRNNTGRQLTITIPQTGYETASVNITLPTGFTFGSSPTATVNLIGGTGLIPVISATGTTPITDAILTATLVTDTTVTSTAKLSSVVAKTYAGPADLTTWKGDTVTGQKWTIKNADGTPNAYSGPLTLNTMTQGGVTLSTNAATMTNGVSTFTVTTATTATPGTYTFTWTTGDPITPTVDFNVTVLATPPAVVPSGAYPASDTFAGGNPGPGYVHTYNVQFTQGAART